MNNTIKIILFASITVLYACGGTHGKIESFEFNAPKDSVEKIINGIVGNESLRFIPNDYTNYMDVYIANSKHFKIFTYRFYGDTNNWKNSKTSAIMLVYVKKGEKFYKESELSNADCRIAIRDFNEHFIAPIRVELAK